MDTHESYVSLETAKLLKQAGFDWKINDGYILYEDGGSFVTTFQTFHNFNGNNGELFNNYLHHKEVLSRPTLSVAQRWLREVKNIHLYIEPHYYSHYAKSGKLTDESFAYYYVGTYDFDEEVDISGYEKTYEETIEAGIKKALELILEKGE